MIVSSVVHVTNQSRVEIFISLICGKNFVCLRINDREGEVDIVECIAWDLLGPEVVTLSACRAAFIGTHFVEVYSICNTYRSWTYFWTLRGDLRLVGVSETEMWSESKVGLTRGLAFW